jgi:hypothetical protein
MAMVVEKAVEMGFDADASRCAYLTLGEGRACLDAVVDLLMSSSLPSASTPALPVPEEQQRKRTRR